MTLSSVICINKHVLNFANVALLCVAKSLATLGCMHILTYSIIFVHQSGGRVARAERAGFAGKSLHKISVLKYICTCSAVAVSSSACCQCRINHMAEAAYATGPALLGAPRFWGKSQNAFGRLGGGARGPAPIICHGPRGTLIRPCLLLIRLRRAQQFKKWLVP